MSDKVKEINPKTESKETTTTASSKEPKEHDKPQYSESLKKGEKRDTESTMAKESSTPSVTEKVKEAIATPASSSTKSETAADTSSSTSGPAKMEGIESTVPGTKESLATEKQKETSTTGGTTPTTKGHIHEEKGESTTSGGVAGEEGVKSLQNVLFRDHGFICEVWCRFKELSRGLVGI
jgi:hypothetical protein